MFQFQDEIEIIMLVVSELESAACDRDPVRELDYDVSRLRSRTRSSCFISYSQRSKHFVCFNS
jgi:hypothetical protein